MPRTLFGCHPPKSRLVVGARVGMQLGMLVQVLTERAVEGIDLAAAQVVSAALAGATRFVGVVLSSAERTASRVHGVGLTAARASLAGGLLWDSLVHDVVRRLGADE